ncbi:MAG: methionine gamma-lyase family protein [Heliobacteriaceae bacterium]|jgi:cystathionine beta-lyase family protein involved in aluminum resistance|nr:methionine gamma-lyase family protein [Heliobacteriaceae bacterium]
MIREIEKSLTAEFERVDGIRDFNQKKVLEAFINNRVAPEHFYTVSGYGHDDAGRDVLDRVFADVFRAEKALVRVHFVSGTHTLACCLFGNLRSGDKLVSVAGAPYDTMQKVIGTSSLSLRERVGVRGQSLIEQGIQYEEIPLKDGLNVDFDKLSEIKDAKMFLIQRSRGYSLRKSLSIADIEQVCKIVKSNNPECICFVDNCYGEFTETREPLEAGADLIAGSLIKNPGGGIVEAGGYVAGRADLVENTAIRLTAPGIGSEGGAMFNQHRLLFQGLFMAPSVVADAVKGAILAAKTFENLGYISTPKHDEPRTDIIQTITFNSQASLEHFCKTIQEMSPVNSHVTPIPDDVPGYDDKVIMAGGTFIEGSTIELSADGPLRPPYAAYMQGGLNYAHVKIVLDKILLSLRK